MTECPVCGREVLPPKRVPDEYDVYTPYREHRRVHYDHLDAPDDETYMTTEWDEAVDGDETGVDGVDEEELGTYEVTEYWETRIVYEVEARDEHEAKEYASLEGEKIHEERTHKLHTEVREA